MVVFPFTTWGLAMKHTKTEIPDHIQKICLCDLEASNRLIDKWYRRLADTTFADFYKMLRAQPEGIVQLLPADQSAEFLADREAIMRLAAPRQELSGQTIHEVIMELYQPLAWKFARTFHKRNPLVEVEDYHQEAVLKIWDSMHRWMPDKGGKLMTLFWSSIGNRLQTVANQQGSRLSHLTNNDIKLVKSYNSIAAKGQNLTFEQTCSQIGLNSWQRTSLSKALGAVVAVSDTGSKLDYLKSSSDAAPDWEQQEFIESVLSKSGLSPLEATLLKFSMENELGWQTQFAEAHISPMTGNTVTRARVGQILRVAERKVRDYLLANA